MPPYISPLRGLLSFNGPHQGRCPWLSYFAPPGLNTHGAFAAHLGLTSRRLLTLPASSSAVCGFEGSSSQLPSTMNLY